MILLIDNYDSFTYNVFQYLSELGAQVDVVRNDKITVKAIEKQAPETKATIKTASIEPEQKSPDNVRELEIMKKREELVSKKNALNKEFDELMKEKQQLDDSNKDLNDEVSIAEYNRSVRRLNEKIKKYREDEQSLKEEIENYNKEAKQTAAQ